MGVAMWTRLRDWLRDHRARLAKAALLLAVLGVGGELVGAYPRDVQLELELSAAADVRELRVAYVQDGQEVHVVQLVYPRGAPERVRHAARLHPGRYDLQLEARGDQGAVRRQEHSVEVPVEGTVRVALGPPGAR